jgi:uncharacterized protein YciI
MPGTTVERPSSVTEEHLDYLDDLRAAGVTNMFGAGPYLQDEFGLDRATATEILAYWMKTFSERHPKGTRQNP